MALFTPATESVRGSMGGIREETEGWEEKWGEYPVQGPGALAVGS